MENKTRVRDAFKAVWEVGATLFSKQEDNQMLKDLKIVKGIKAGIGYLIFLGFVLPAKILTFILKPSWTWIHFTQRHLVSPLFEIEALTGSESPSRLLGEIYERNLNYFKNIEDSGVSSSTLKPSISVLERIMIFAKVRVLITLAFFSVVAMVVYELFDLIVELVSILTAFVVSSIGFMGVDGLYIDTLLFGLTFGAIIGYAFWILGGAIIAYLVMFAVRFLVESIRSVMYAERQMLKDFVDDSVHYTVAKSIDLYGEDVALQAYDLLLENVVIDQARYTTDEPHYKRLELLKKEENVKLIDDLGDKEDGKNN